MRLCKRKFGLVLVEFFWEPIGEQAAVVRTARLGDLSMQR